MICRLVKSESRLVHISFIQKVVQGILGRTMKLIRDATGFESRKSRQFQESSFKSLVGARFHSDRDAIHEIHGVVSFEAFFASSIGHSGASSGAIPWR